MRILVTGGAGFIGSNFIRYALKKDKRCSIVNLDRLSYAGNLDNLRDIEDNPRYSFIKGDICDRPTVDKAISGCDYVINFAAESHVDRSIIDPAEFVRTNILGVNVLLDAVLSVHRSCGGDEKGKTKVKKFIQISTDEVCGSIDKGSFTEESPLLPNSPYSASKAGAELLCRSYFITFGLPVVITRSSNNFGPYQYPEKFTALSITNLIEAKKIPLYGDGGNVRDWIYVEDNCGAIYFILENGLAGEIYNIAGGSEIANIEMAGSILELMGKSPESIEYINDRPGHDRRYSLDDSKIRRLGWRPQEEFKGALRKTVDWYIKNQAWWHKIKNKSKDYAGYYKKQYHTCPN